MSTDKLKHFGFLIKDLTRRYVSRFEHHAQETSLTLMQCKVLVHLEKSEGASQARLAELTDMDPMMMVRILDRMETDNLLERRPDPVDRRARRLYLTKKSKPLLDEVWRLVDITRSEVFAGISKADRDTFMRILEQVHDNACALSDEQEVAGPTITPAKSLRSKALRESRSTAGATK